MGTPSFNFFLKRNFLAPLTCSQTTITWKIAHWSRLTLLYPTYHIHHPFSGTRGFLSSLMWLPYPKMNFLPVLQLKKYPFPFRPGLNAPSSLAFSPPIFGHGTQRLQDLSLQSRDQEFYTFISVFIVNGFVRSCLPHYPVESTQTVYDCSPPHGAMPFPQQMPSKHAPT